MQILQGDAAREQLDRLRYQIARRSICGLGSITIPDYDRLLGWHQRTKARALEAAIKYARFGGRQGGISRLLISEPPQYGKSLHAAQLAPALALGQDPDMTVIATAYGSTLAARNAEETKAIMATPGYKAAFPTRIGRALEPKTGRVVRSKDQTAYFKTMREHSDGSVTPARGHYYSGGITAGLTGHGFKFGIIDDWIKDEQDAISYRAQSQRIGVYTKAFNTRQQGPSAIVAIATMWDNPDWLDWLWDLWTAQRHDPVWIRFPALTDDTALYPLHPDDPRSEGSDEGLWPVRFPTETVRQERDGLILQDRSAWQALYQQNPLRIAGQLFPKKAWQHFSVTGAQSFDLRQLSEIHISIDGNVKETGASFAVIGVYGVLRRRSPEGGELVHFFRLDESRGHFDFATLRDETLRLWGKWLAAHERLMRAGMVWVEDKANGPALMSQLAGRGIPFKAVPKARSKLSCYRMSQLAVMEGRCWLPSDSDGLVTNDWVGGPTGFVSELAAQPSEPDDRADEFSQMVICNDPNLGIDLLRV